MTRIVKIIFISGGFNYEKNKKKKIENQHQFSKNKLMNNISATTTPLFKRTKIMIFNLKTYHSIVEKIKTGGIVNESTNNHNLKQESISSRRGI